MDGKANKEGGAFERKSLRRPQFAPGQDALLDSAPPSDSLAQAFSTNPAAIRARKAREESRAQHGPPVKGPQAPAITGRVRVVATTNAASADYPRHLASIDDEIIHVYFCKKIVASYS